MEKYISDAGLTLEAVAVCYALVMLVMLIQVKIK